MVGLAVVVGLIVALAAAVGVSAGAWCARWMTDLYAEFYEFPTRLYELSPGVVALTLVIGAGAAVIGALTSVRRIARMPPAQAMRPPAPLSYRWSWVERVLGLAAPGPVTMMIVRG